MDHIKRAAAVRKLCEETHRVMEADCATLTDAWYDMSSLRKAIQCTSMLSDEDRRHCIALLDTNLVKRTHFSELALCIAIDPRQCFGRGENKLMSEAKRGLQKRLKRVYDLKVISSAERISAFESKQVLRGSLDPSKGSFNVFAHQPTKDECTRLGLSNWWKNHVAERSAFFEYVVRPIAGVRPSASNTECNNSLHNLLIGDKRAMTKNKEHACLQVVVRILKRASYRRSKSLHRV